MRVPVRLTGIEPGVVFIPFHYGDAGDDAGEATAANRLTMTGWDPVSKQPHFKYAAVSVHPVRSAGDRRGAAGPTRLAGRRPRGDRDRTEEAEAVGSARSAR